MFVVDGLIWFCEQFCIRQNENKSYRNQAQLLSTQTSPCSAPIECVISIGSLCTECQNRRKVEQLPSCTLVATSCTTVPVARCICGGRSQGDECDEGRGAVDPR